MLLSTLHQNFLHHLLLWRHYKFSKIIVVYIFLFHLWRFLANHLLSWLGDDGVLYPVINSLSFDLLRTIVGGHGIFGPRIFLFFKITVFVVRFTVFNWRLWEKVLIAYWCTRNFTRSLSTAIGSSHLFCA